VLSSFSDQNCRCCLQKLRPALRCLQKRVAEVEVVDSNIGWASRSFQVDLEHFVEEITEGASSIVVW